MPKAQQLQYRMRRRPPAKANGYIYCIIYIIILSAIGLLLLARQLPTSNKENGKSTSNKRDNGERKSSSDGSSKKFANSPTPKPLPPHYESSIKVPPPVQIEPVKVQLRGAANNPSKQQNHPSKSSAVTPSFHSDPSRLSKPSTAVKTQQVISSKSAGQAVDSLGLNTILLIICSNRPDYLKKTLSYVLQFHPRTSVPILISQDGDSIGVKAVVDDARKEFETKSSIRFDHIQFRGEGFYENGYFRLADHYKWALNKAFAWSPGDSQLVENVIILEEDLQIAPDFFEYFAATKPLLDQEDTLLTISAWNDNGFESQVKDETMLYRSDFFPGLGWMMTRKLWNELSVKWPKAYWDDWLREPKQRKGRQIIRPEVCRTLHFGVKGVSNSQYSNYLTQIRLNDKHVPFSTLDLSYLKEGTWDQWYITRVRQAPLVHSQHEADDKMEAMTTDEEKNIGLRIRYDSLDAKARNSDSFSAIAKWSGAMDNVKAMVPRTAYKGIVTVYKNGVKLHLIPKEFT